MTATYEGYRLIRVAARDGICRASIDHPPINLLDVPLLAEIDRLAREVMADDDVRVLIVDSADPEIFIAHADVGLILDLPAPETGETVALHDDLTPFHQTAELFRTMPKATIAVIEGLCRGGGCELVMAFDMRFAALGVTVLGHPEVTLGIIPGGGGTQRLPRLIGRGRALEVILGGMDVDAATAEAWGYVDRALPPDQLRRFVDKLARRIAAAPATAIAAAKRAIDAAGAAAGDFATGLRVEDQLFRQALAEPAARDLLQTIIEAGAQTREFELGDRPRRSD